MAFNVRYLLLIWNNAVWAFVYVCFVYILIELAKYIKMGFKYGFSNLKFYYQTDDTDLCICGLILKRDDYIKIYDRVENKYTTGYIIGRNIENYILVRDDDFEKVFYFDIGKIKKNDIEVVIRRKE